mgnify:CR=1 FL=1
MTVFEYLNLRYEWEEIVKQFKIPDGQNRRKIGTMDNLEYFAKRGLVNNRFRDGYDRAFQIAEHIVNSSR